MPTEQRENEILTTGAVARALGVSETRVRQLVEAGEISCERTIAGMRLYRRSDVERILRQRTAAK